MRPYPYVSPGKNFLFLWLIVSFQTSNSKKNIPPWSPGLFLKQDVVPVIKKNAKYMRQDYQREEWKWWSLDEAVHSEEIGTN